MSELLSHFEELVKEINSKEKLLLNYVPVYIVLPLFGIVAVDNKNAELEETKMRLEKLKKEACIDGVMVDVWWGIVEYENPKVYTWEGYQKLFKMIMSLELKVHVIMSFHKSSDKERTRGLPKWVVRYGEDNPDIYYTDRNGFADEGCLSLGVDDVPLPDVENVKKEDKRTAIQMYSDFMKSFRQEMKEFLESGVIVAIEVGLGPNGELCYPSFPTEVRKIEKESEEEKEKEKEREIVTQKEWKFPGIGEFQCYDKYMKKDYDNAAKGVKHSDPDLLNKDFLGFGNYNSESVEDTEFFKKDGTYTTKKGEFFLEWYSNKLILHGDKILREANEIFTGFKIDLVAKVSGVHWFYNHHSHAAELTAGYYNLGDNRDGYRPIARMLYKRNCLLNFSCLEMKYYHYQQKDFSAPEELVKAVLTKAWEEGLDVIGANTSSEKIKGEGYDQVLRYVKSNSSNPVDPNFKLHSFMYLRLSDKIFEELNYKEFKKFVRKMHADLDYCGDAEKYAHEVESNSAMTLEEISAASKIKSIIRDKNES